MTNIDILTFGTGYGEKIYERFIGTLKASGFIGTLYIIILDSDKHKLDKISKHNPTMNIIAISINMKNIATHINNYRFLVMRNILETKIISPNAPYIFICDLRDVLFQKNIHDFIFDENVDIFGFQEGILIKDDQQYNSRWIKMLETILKEDIYTHIKNNYVICCGTTLIKNNYLLKYLTFMTNIICDNNITDNLDQEIHNYMLYFNKLNCNIRILTNIDNFVNTVGNDQKKLIDNQIVNVNNDVSYIVHQYDRLSKSQKNFLAVKYNHKYDFSI